MVRSTFPTTFADASTRLFTKEAPMRGPGISPRAPATQLRLVTPSKRPPNHPRARIQMPARLQWCRSCRFLRELQQRWWLWVIAFTTARWAELHAQAVTARAVRERPWAQP